MGAFTGFYLILVVVFNGGVFTYLDKKVLLNTLTRK